MSTALITNKNQKPTIAFWSVKLYLQQIRLNVVGFTVSSLAFEHFRINCKDCISVISDIRMPGWMDLNLLEK
jgi:hypothetical protein